ncbi:MAG: hypothetical protein JWO82_1556, partial [Akkermansiaceae bacterium]|nr:hypothetical protein [Akkermansiaceae bacterium]
AIVAFCVLIGLSKKNMYDGDHLNTLQNAASVRQVEANKDFEFVQARIQAGLVPQRGEEERQVRVAKDKADDEFHRFQEQRAELARPSVFWWVFVAIAVLGFFGGCACGWVALVLIHRHELLAGKGRAVTSALLVPVIGLGLFLESTVWGFIDHMKWKNEELIQNVTRLFIVLGWMMATVWLTATVMRWARRETPVAARLNRTFVLGTTGLSGILLLVFFIEKI